MKLIEYWKFLWNLVKLYVWSAGKFPLETIVTLILILIGIGVFIAILICVYHTISWFKYKRKGGN